VLAVYLGGTLANGKDDLYSDIDLRVVVPNEKKAAFVAEKQNRARRWGNVLFFEDWGPRVTHTVAHYDCFVKIDVFYYQPDDLKPSLWLKDIKVMYDPHKIVTKVREQSASLAYRPTAQEIEWWRGKTFACIHEVYRRVMREEMYYALQMLDGIRWLIAAGWEMEAGRMPNSLSDWSKLEGHRSCLKDWQLALLAGWDSARNPDDIMKTLAAMIPEFLRVHKCICKKYGVDEKEELCRQIIDMVL
jgi:hypothetical protein